MKAVVFLGVASGIDYIHDKGMIHRDLRPSSILLDKHLRPKITDFVPEEGDVHETNVGTTLYMAPEVSYGRYNHRADFYSFGATLYEMFEGTEMLRRAYTVLGHLESLQFTDQTPPAVQEFIQSCLRPDPDDRCPFLDESDTMCLFEEALRIVRSGMGLNESDLSEIEAFVTDILAETDNDEDLSDEQDESESWPDEQDKSESE